MKKSVIAIAVMVAVLAWASSAKAAMTHCPKVLSTTEKADMGGRKAASVSQSYNFGGASGSWDDDDPFPVVMPF